MVVEGEGRVSCGTDSGSHGERRRETRYDEIAQTKRPDGKKPSRRKGLCLSISILLGPAIDTKGNLCWSRMWNSNLRMVFVSIRTIRPLESSRYWSERTRSSGRLRPDPVDGSKRIKWSNPPGYACGPTPFTAAGTNEHREASLCPATRELA